MNQPQTPDNEVAPIHQIQSAYLNLRTATSDVENARDAWEEERWASAVMHIDLAIQQLESGKHKIQHHKQK